MCLVGVYCKFAKIISFLVYIYELLSVLYTGYLLFVQLRESQNKSTDYLLGRKRAFVKYNSSAQFYVATLMPPCN